VSFCLKRSPLTAGEIDRVRRFCTEMGFDPLLLPGLRPGERERFNQLPDQSFFRLLDRILSADRQEIYDRYLFNLRPATDNRPFFSQFLRWETLPHLAALVGQRALPAMELGSLVLFVTFFLLTSAAVILILLPLWRLGWRGRHRPSVVGYFGSLGLGYMLVEIALIHQFVLYLGHPVHAAATVICALLVGSGIGSACSGRLPRLLGRPQRAAVMVALLLAGVALLLPALLHQTIILPTNSRMALALALLVPVGFAMGLPFPLGLGELHRRQPETVPWAWGINGCLSVVGTTLATIIAISAGFKLVLAAAVLAYLAGTLAGHRLFPEGSPDV
jgi:hypothetical protein